MNKLRYPISHVSKWFGLTKQALRFYEEKGLLHPEIDEENNYRYYSNTDMSQLYRIRPYRNRGFSLKEIKKLLTTKDPDLHKKEYVALIQRQTKELRQLEQTIALNRKMLQTLENLDSILNRLELTVRGKVYYVDNNTEDVFQHLESWITSMPLVHAASFFDPADFVTSGSYGYCLFCDDYDSPEKYESAFHGHSLLLPEQKCLYTAYVHNGRNYLEKMESLRTQAENLNYILDGIWLTRPLTSYIDNGKEQYVCELWIPVK